MFFWAIVGGVLGAVLYRWRGGGFFSAPRFLRLSVWIIALYGPLFFLGFPWWAVLLAAAASAYGLATGHGSFQDWGLAGTPETHEQVCGAVHLVTKTREGYIHDSLGMALTGVLMTLPLVFFFPLLALAGVLKAVAYSIGWELWKATGRDLKRVNPTETAEWLTGLFIFLPVYGAYAAAW